MQDEAGFMFEKMAAFKEQQRKEFELQQWKDSHLNNARQIRKTPVAMTRKAYKAIKAKRRITKASRVANRTK